MLCLSDGVVGFSQKGLTLLNLSHLQVTEYGFADCFKNSLKMKTDIDVHSVFFTYQCSDHCFLNPFNVITFLCSTNQNYK